MDSGLSLFERHWLEPDIRLTGKLSPMEDALSWTIGVRNGHSDERREASASKRQSTDSNQRLKRVRSAPVFHDHPARDPVDVHTFYDRLLVRRWNAAIRSHVGSACGGSSYDQIALGDLLSDSDLKVRVGGSHSHGGPGPDARKPSPSCGPGMYSRAGLHLRRIRATEHCDG